MKQTLVEDIKQGPNKSKNGPLRKRRRGEKSDKSSWRRGVVASRRKKKER